MKNNNIRSLNCLHSDVLTKSRSSIGLRTTKPLSQIQNSIEKIKNKKQKSKSKSKSKENTPDYDKKRSDSKNSSKVNNIYFHRLNQKTKAFLNKPKKPVSQLDKELNSMVSAYDPKLNSKTVSELSIQSKQLIESNVSSVNTEYQLPSNMSQKSVKFSDKNLEVNLLKLKPKKKEPQSQQRLRTPSILKRQQSSSSSIESVRSTSSFRSNNNNIKISRNRQLLQMQNSNTNKVVKSKYDALLSRLQKQNQKWTKNLSKNYNKLQKFSDDMFPPANSSIYSYSIHNKTQKQKIQWKRIPQLFPGMKLVLIRDQQDKKSHIKVIKNPQSPSAQYIATCFNCIKQNRNVLQQIFQDRLFNFYGIYLLNIYQQNSWKYVLIDDLIPTIFDQNKGIFKPAFTGIQTAQGNNSQQMQIWPLLLQKAYASYYSKYQALNYGNQVNFLEQIIGVPSRIIQTKKLDFEKQQEIHNIENLLKDGKCCILGSKIQNQSTKEIINCILPDLNSITKRSQGFVNYLTAEKNYKPSRQRIQVLLKSLQTLYIYERDTLKFNTISYICCPKNRTERGGKFPPKNNNRNIPLPIQTQLDGQISQRSFIIQQSQNCIISIKQKDNKFYFQGKQTYNYIWIRVVLLLKQHNDELRWIDAKYSKNKCLSFHKKLQAGQYTLLIMPQWNTTHNKFDLTLNIHAEKSPIKIQKQPYNRKQQLFQKGCADIAQRQGFMIQINKYICAYNYVSEQSGLVIENINNQRQKGPVTVMRSINGLKCQVDLIPVNQEFYYETSSQYDSQAVKKMKKTIQVDIEADQSYTVVLKTMGGVDHKFFDSFDFGC